jgi:hypothetical protein
VLLANALKEDFAPGTVPKLPVPGQNHNMKAGGTAGFTLIYL